ncbi:squalene synthetase-like protein [Sporothrix stenoceras]
MDLDLLVEDSNNDGGSDAAVNDYIQNMSTEDMAYMVRQLTANHRELGGFDSDIFIDIASDDNNEGNASDQGSGDNGGGTASHAATQDRKGKRSRRTQKATNNVTNSDDSDDAWQLATDSDDEHLARLLAKQEELGLEGDDLILLDSDTTAAATRHGKRPRRPKGSLHWSSAALTKYGFTKGCRTSNGPYPSAEAVADAFEQLEVNGWSSSRGGFELDLSDSDLESTLKASWQKDRQRKKDRKKAREELRAQGLLGKRVNPNDPRIKYPGGMSLDDMKAEFRSFLLGSDQSLTLAPMDAQARKIVHEIAYRFNITSKSTGSGDQRRPTLARTKGRTMLEKMGWSTGMALGAMDNKGMTQIIEHIVKRSKAGLG